MPADTRIQPTCRCHRRSDAASGSNVILFDQDAVVQGQPLVLAAADTHRIFLCKPQARQGLARIEYRSARASGQPHVIARRGGDCG
jgi:hypothetical protein